MLDQRKKSGMAGERGAGRVRQAANTGRGQSTWDLTGYGKEFGFHFAYYGK